jgi:hypothetical protein
MEGNLLDGYTSRGTLLGGYARGGDPAGWLLVTQVKETLLGGYASGGESAGWLHERRGPCKMVSGVDQNLLDGSTSGGDPT